MEFIKFDKNYYALNFKWLIFSLNLLLYKPFFRLHNLKNHNSNTYLIKICGIQMSVMFRNKNWYKTFKSQASLFDIK